MCEIRLPDGRKDRINFERAEEEKDNLRPWGDELHNTTRLYNV